MDTVNDTVETLEETQVAEQARSITIRRGGIGHGLTAGFRFEETRVNDHNAPTNRTLRWYRRTKHFLGFLGFRWKTRHWDRSHFPGCPKRYHHEDGPCLGDICKIGRG